jgi:hypothetical protein
MVTAPVVGVLAVMSVEMVAVFLAEAELLCLPGRHSLVVTVFLVMAVFLGLAGRHATVPWRWIVVVVTRRALRQDGARR